MQIFLYLSTFLFSVITLSTQAATLVHIGSVAPDVLALEFQAQSTIPARQVPYDSQLLDSIEQKERHIWVRRYGEVIGALAGRDRKTFYPYDRVEGQPLNTTWADTPSSYRLINTSSGKPVLETPVNVYRKSRPNNIARTGFWQFAWPSRHFIYLQFAKPLQEGGRYLLQMPGSQFPPYRYTHNTLTVRSEAVHLSQLGFRPDDPTKQGFLSLWRGNGGGQNYASNLPFHIIDNQTNRSLFRGSANLSRGAREAEDSYGNNYNKTDVLQLDFSEFRRPGDYRLCVAKIGCSYPFQISDQSWLRAYRIAARGFYHQRSGIELGPPYTQYRRPRNFHPDDGVRVIQSRTPLIETANGLNAHGNDPDNFTNLIRGRTAQTLSNAWGGYADAGDWDRRIQHLRIARLLLELYEMFPGYFSRVNLNIPESGNQLADNLDEALWGLDLFRRLQTVEGGVRGGIESAEHPRHGEASWQESLEVFAYAPDHWSSYIYAGVAARAAFVLQDLSPEKARQYRTSALAAMNWAERKRRTVRYPKPLHQVNDERNLAAAELFRLTGEQRWHRIFVDTTAFTAPGTPLKQWQKHDQSDAAFLYLRSANADKALKKRMLQAMIAEAEFSISQSGQTGFRWTKRESGEWVGWGMLSTPGTLTLVRSHYLTGKQRYLKAALASASFGAGANPLNMTFTTGTGINSPRNPLHHDSRVSAQPAPPGITVNGPLELRHQVNYWTAKLFRSVIFPAHSEWPVTEAYFDLYTFAPLTEFTVYTTMANNTYLWGYFAARPSQGTRSGAN
ncbi:glycoside hydrolase family 9 protein [Marinobacterium jannaschii]|uniref:glycoside hydrolase family 9 protein n=1 Tax=Marinobacterium jannaschii TaxID=64970 RepID=UPI000684BE7D|nr:glycoside hydrolase family 9 protein [Marinobacterium jannaschii]